MHIKHPHIIHPKYRPDIDGLRAIAIISVVLFHAFRKYISGGFIGVDIFFVISGYLISTIIFSSLEQDRFSIVEFYIRRVRRIFPALVIVLLSSIIFGWFVLLPDEYERFGKHLDAGVVFISNFVFWHENGYFDTISETKPLLHLWSLAIEEQFYLLWPMLLALLWKKGIGFLTITAAIAIVSFIANIYLVNDHPVAAFYLPISRFWELMAGGVLSYISMHRPKLISKYKNGQSFLGFSLIVIGLLSINQGSHFPGYLALLPIFGAIFIISGGPDTWLNKIILSNRLMTWVGQISYPAYLWHWPLLSFVYVIDDGNVPYAVVLICLLLTILLSSATYYFIEKPIRFGKFKSHSVPLLLTLMAGLLIIGFFIQFGSIHPRNDSYAISKIVDARNDWDDFSDIFSKFGFDGETFYRSKSSSPGVTVLLGDSHTLQYLPRVTYLLRNSPKKLNTIYFAMHEGCMPIPGISTESIVCNSYRNSAMNKILNNPDVKTIVLGGCWNCYLIPYPKSKNIDIQREGYVSEEQNKKNLKSLEQFLFSIGKSKTVYLLLDNPLGSEFEPSQWLHGNRLAGISVSPAPLFVNMPNEQLNLRRQLIEIAKQANVNIIDPVDTLCKNGMCSISTKNGEPIYKDGNHLRASYIRQNASYIDNALLEN